MNPFVEWKSLRRRRRSEECNRVDKQTYVDTAEAASIVGGEPEVSFISMSTYMAELGVSESNCISRMPRERPAECVASLSARMGR
jgi:hypothetical protein